MTKPPEPLEGEVLGDEIETPKAHDVTPGWVSRNRQTLERARTVARAAMVIAPPPVRIPLALVSLAADTAILTADIRRRREDAEGGGLKGVALTLEGAAMLAATRFAPARLAANLGALEAARRVTDRLISQRTAS